MAVTRTRLGRVIPGTTPRPMTEDTLDIDWGDAATGGGATTVTEETTSRGGAGSILSGQAARTRAETERIRLANEAAAAAAALQRQQAGARAQEAYLRSQLGAGIPASVTGAFDEQQAAGERFIQDQAAALLRQLQERETQSRGLTTTGFSNLMNYLASNQPTAFAQAQRVMPTVTQSALGQYMTGQGVSPAAAQEAATLANIQAAGGASNYNQLLNVLAAREQSAQGSRQAEAEMGLTSQLANLQALYGQGTAGLEQQRLAALQQLQTTITNARLQAAQQQAARDAAIQDALAALYGTGLVSPPAPEAGFGGRDVAPGGFSGEQSGVIPPPAPTLTRAQRVATAGEDFANFRQAVQALNPRAVAALSADGSLSRADIEELKRRNPELAAQFR